MKGNARLFLWLALVNGLWAPVNLMVQIARRGGFSPAGTALVRWVGIAVLLAVIVRLPFVQQKLKLRWPTRRDAIWAFLLGVSFTAPAHLLYYLALQHTGSVEGTVFNTTAPLWTALFAGFLLRERITGLRWTALFLGIAGAYVTCIGFGPPTLQAGHLGWNGLYMLGTILECVGGVWIAGLIKRSSGLTVLSYETIGMATILCIAPLVFRTSLPVVVPVHLGNSGWLAVGYLILFAGLVTFGGWTTLVEKAPLSLMVVSIAIQTPLAALLGYLTLGERLTWDTLAGSVLVAIGLALGVADHSSGQQLSSGVDTRGLAVAPSEEMAAH